MSFSIHEKVDAQKAAIKARNLCNALAKEYSGDDVVRCITTSIGLAVSGIDGDTYEELLKRLTMQCTVQKIRKKWLQGC